MSEPVPGPHGPVIAALNSLIEICVEASEDWTTRRLPAGPRAGIYWSQICYDSQIGDEVKRLKDAVRGGLADGQAIEKELATELLAAATRTEMVAKVLLDITPERRERSEQRKVYFEAVDTLRKLLSRVQAEKDVASLMAGDPISPGGAEANSKPGGLGGKGETTDVLPRWDEEWRTLWYGNTKVKVFRRQPAKNQIDLIEAFHNANWTRSIVDPFDDAAKLKQTIDNLNPTLAPNTIRFGRDGTGEGALWELAATAAEDTPEVRPIST